MKQNILLPVFSVGALNVAEKNIYADIFSLPLTVRFYQHESQLTNANFIPERASCAGICIDINAMEKDFFWSKKTRSLARAKKIFSQIDFPVQKMLIKCPSRPQHVCLVVRKSEDICIARTAPFSERLSRMLAAELESDKVIWSLLLKREAKRTWPSVLSFRESFHAEFASPSFFWEMSKKAPDFQNTLWVFIVRDMSKIQSIYEYVPLSVAIVCPARS